MQVFLVLDLKVGHSRLQLRLVKNCSRKMGFDSFYFIVQFVLEVPGCKLLSEDFTQKKTSQDGDNEEGGLLSMRNEK